MEEVMSRTESMEKMSFPKLNHLKLQHLPDLVTFSSEIFIEFPVLTQLCIEDCPEFKTFTSRSEGKFSTTIPSLFNDNVRLIFNIIAFLLFFGYYSIFNILSPILR